MISYIGGKARQASWIAEFIPNDIETYVEVFGGAFWVYIKGNVHTKFKLQTIVYNDFNRHMTNLFACCKTPEIFYDYVGDIKSLDEELFYEFQKDVFAQDVIDIQIPNYDIALKYAYITTHIYSGATGKNDKFISAEFRASKFEAFKDRLRNPKIVSKLEKISYVENMDFQNVINKYDSSKTFFYIDPPYFKTENYYSHHDFDVDDHKRLANVLQNIEGKFALSYYNFDLLHEWFPEDNYTWERKEYTKFAGAKTGLQSTIAEEILIMNYDITNIPIWE